MWRLTIIGVPVSIALIASAQAANILWLETEQFVEYGGWTKDSPFVDFVGSA